jgi:hypothetical protein
MYLKVCEGFTGRCWRSPRRAAVSKSVSRHAALPDFIVESYEQG